ncbi:Isochorismatase-like protein [Chaetomidium leptoderma]|uniref:Isochorismatase-like protein n=1 Tax=Chaetomidium leptoderma TaxID=669021 RepID=A0AAN6VIN8_9PEZI|nr:Isochorismatase-like protein [Chaetomidium leptoderma]
MKLNPGSLFTAMLVTWPVLVTAYTYERLDREKAAVAIIDHQVGLFHLVRDFEPTYFRQQMLGHARIAKAFGLPVVLTTSAQVGPNGPLPREIIDMFPDAPLVQRQGEVNAMDSPEFRTALAGLNRTQVIVGGIATDVCTTFAALSMVEAGYSVFANADASGTTDTLTRDLANQRMINAGVHLLSPAAVLGELMRDWRTPPVAAEPWPLLESLMAAGGMLARSHGSAVESGELMPGQTAIPW